VERDGLRCSWSDAEGRRCEERAWLEYDHRHPRAKGGAFDTRNLRLLCRSHNRIAAELEYGREHVEQAMSTSSKPSFENVSAEQCRGPKRR
jgi:5-methylcytosine-specific restriction endonuclease McrA